MKVERDGDRWVCRANFATSHIPRDAGFRCSPNPGPNGERIWYTTDPVVAARLVPESEVAALRAAHEERYRLSTAAVNESSADTTEFDVPVPDGRVMRAYQRVGVEWSVKRYHTLNADDPGLGKTIQAAGLINALRVRETLKKILVLCPNSLRINWLRELQRWLVPPRMNIAVWNSEVCRPGYVDISILHYDALYKFADVLRAVTWDLIIADECHLLKNPSARRTRAVFGVDKRTAARQEKKRLEKLDTFLPGADVPKALLEPIVVVPPLRGRRSLFMTGTPLPNRPKEIYPILHYLDPVTFKSESKFVRQFCDGSFTPFGVSDKGASNLEELQRLLRSTVMIRRQKAHVLKELPPKQRCVIEIPHAAGAVVAAELEAYKVREAELEAMRAAVAAAKQRADEDPESYAAAVKALKAGTVAAFSEISKQRRETSRAKLPYVLEHLRNLVEAGEKLIVFAHHQEIIEAIAKEFGRRCVTCYGPDSTSPNGGQRQRNVDRFQNDPSCLIIAGNYDTMGVGYTLTASWHVVAAELDWVPGRMTQAEDRAHRIGQVNTVLVEHLVLEGSLDAHMAVVVVEKQEVQAEALDIEAPLQIPNAAAARPHTPLPAPPAPHSHPAPATRPETPTSPVGPPQGLDHYSQVSLFDPDAW
jgi:SWI/SNF-related matrix-associated actin-dependent regulator of chromatin subfamily A-like protein 1